MSTALYEIVALLKGSVFSKFMGVPSSSKVRDIYVTLPNALKTILVSRAIVNSLVRLVLEIECP